MCANTRKSPLFLSSGRWSMPRRLLNVVLFPFCIADALKNMLQEMLKGHSCLSSQGKACTMTIAILSYLKLVLSFINLLPSIVVTIPTSAKGPSLPS